MASLISPRRSPLLQRAHARFDAWARRRTPAALPVRFDRHRIYILPTRFGAFFTVLLLVMGVGALNYNNNPALLLCLLLAGAGIASLLQAQLQLGGLEIHAIGAEPVPAGTALLMRVHARAPVGRARRGLRVECGGQAAVLSLDDGAGEAVLSLPTATRGWLDPGRLRISTTRPLGLARAWAYAWSDAPLLVYPAPEAGGPPLPSGAGDSLHSRLQPAGDDVHHLRDWRRGDSRRAVAWKASARRDALLVREFEQPLGADIVLDWRALAALRHEDRIRRLARWVDEAERESRRYRLLLPGQPPLGPGSGAAHRHACLRALALLPKDIADGAPR
ncbi:DUF58 domain-containing protein [Luteimonas marina]|uniref:DUF58 domain-containing protein n=1 Tax=Luteimonas marina TaxID=488485 RepID=A0A5C5U3X2_9GAMM|nr:DUF58 domain-containing protein [Luteimonas marina]TWT20090.1 DUF58 domain-containing protein [Luteimonas marina]